MTRIYCTVHIVHWNDFEVTIIEFAFWEGFQEPGGDMMGISMTMRSCSAKPRTRPLWGALQSVGHITHHSLIISPKTNRIIYMDSNWSLQVHEILDSVYQNALCKCCLRNRTRHDKYEHLCLWSQEMAFLKVQNKKNMPFIYFTVRVARLFFVYLYAPLDGTAGSSTTLIFVKFLKHDQCSLFALASKAACWYVISMILVFLYLITFNL